MRVHLLQSYKEHRQVSLQILLTLLFCHLHLHSSLCAYTKDSDESGDIKQINDDLGMEEELSQQMNDEDEDEDEEDNEQQQDVSKLNSLILDICKPLENWGCNINMDNYYMNPMVAAQLKMKGIFCRGTVRKNQRMFLKCIQFSKLEARNMEHGSLWMMVNMHFGIMAFGWLDGNPVHMLSTADGTNVSTISHSTISQRVNITEVEMKAPTAMGKYNMHMQAVD